MVCLLSGLLLTGMLSGCALLELPFQVLGALTGGLVGTWKDDQSRLLAIQPDGTFEVRNGDGQREFRGRCIVSGERIIIRSDARLTNRTGARVDKPGAATAYRFEIRGNRLALSEGRAGDDQKTLLLLSSSSWQRQ